MKVAIPNGGQYDGVKLIADAVFPYPENAIFPIHNWEDLLEVPEEYRIVDQGQVREMTDDEKKIVDNNRLDQLKKDYIENLKNNLYTRMEQGFEYDGLHFSLKKEDLSFWNGIAISTETLSIGDFPINVSSLEGIDYTLQDMDHYKQWYGMGQHVIKQLFEKANKATAAIISASNIDELKAIDITFNEF